MIQGAMNWGCGWALEVSRSECSQLWFHIHQALQCKLLATVCATLLVLAKVNAAGYGFIFITHCNTKLFLVCVPLYQCLVCQIYQCVLMCQLWFHIHQALQCNLAPSIVCSSVLVCTSVLEVYFIFIAPCNANLILVCVPVYQFLVCSMYQYVLICQLWFHIHQALQFIQLLCEQKLLRLDSHCFLQDKHWRCTYFTQLQSAEDQFQFNLNPLIALSSYEHFWMECSVHL